MEIKNLSYEKTIKELEKIIEELESDKFSLDKSVDKFKLGVELYNHCNLLLENAEGEIKVILEEKNGEVKEEDFSVEG